MENKCKPIEQPIKSDSDTSREYRAFVLKNDISVLVVSEPTTDKASAAMDVRVGSFADPSDWPGLAHFCEHMLFLGTKKYPKENYYGEILSAHGGHSNAYTSSESTNYFFEITKNHLKTALDIFAQFFIEPLFTPEGTDREMNAVNSENDKNLQVDSRRFNQILKEEANPKSPYSRFSTGNLATLNKPGIREALLEFYDKFYSANLMKLCILGSESLDELESWAREMFSQIPNKNLPIFREPNVKPFEKEQLQKLFSCVPVKDQRKLKLIWPVHPSFIQHYVAKPWGYFSHLLGHESEGSVYALIKAKGWASALAAGPMAQTDDFELFQVDIDLTEEGFEHREEIISIVFEYIHLLNSIEPQKWVFDEMKTLNEIKFKFLSKRCPYDFCTGTASSMQEYPPEHYLLGPYIITEFNPELVKKYLSYLTPDNLVVMQTGKYFAPECNIEERWYKTKYKKEDIPAQWIQKWSDHNRREHPSLALPIPNPFLPTCLDLKPGHQKTEEEKKSEKEDVPSLILSSESLNVWHLQDRTYLQPKAHVSIQFIIPTVYQSPINLVKTQLILMLLKDELNEYTYLAHLAGLNFVLNYLTSGIQIQVYGYDQKLKVLIESVLQKFVTLEIKSDRLEVQRLVLKENFLNFFKDQPYSHCTYHVNHALNLPQWTVEERLQLLPHITPKELQLFLPNLFSCFLNIYCHGNLTCEEAKSIANNIEGIVKARHIFKSEWPRQRVVKLNKGISHVISKTGYNPDNENSAIFVWWQAGSEDDFQLHTKLLLLGDIFREQGFDQLRTKEQLGYIVWSGVRTQGGVVGYRVTIQSSVKDPVYLDQRIQQFINDAHNRLILLTDEEFTKYKDARIVILLEKCHTLKELHDQYWMEINDWKYRFHRYHELASITKNITLKETIEVFSKIVVDNTTTKRISSRVFGNKHPLTEETETEKLVNLNDIQKFKNSSQLFPVC